MKFPPSLGAIALSATILAGCQTSATHTTGVLSFRQDGQISSKSTTTAKQRTSVKETKAGKPPFDSMIAKHAKANGVPKKLAHAVVYTESTYRADARGAAGEIGLMQVKLATARGVGYKGSAKGLYDPETNIAYGMKYLGQAHKLSGGTTCGTILKYNAGHGAKRMNPISKAYCKKVTRLIER